MLLHELFDFHGRARASQCFAIFEDTTLSYGDAFNRYFRIAAGLRSLGLSPGDRLATLAENSADLLLVFLAASRLGLIIVPLNYRQSPSEWAYLLADSEARAIISDPAFCQEANKLEEVISIARLSFGEESVEGWQSLSALTEARPPATEVTAMATQDDIVFQMYTSGTTGLPKGALISHRNIVSNVTQSVLATTVRLNPGDRTLVNLPLFHIAAINTALQAIACGATLVIHRTVDAEKTLKALEEEGIVTLSLVPAVIQFLISVPGIEERSFQNLRAIGYGASPIAEPVLRRAMGVFKCDFLQGYGMTELAGSCTMLSEEDHRRALSGQPELLLSAGRALPGTRIRIVDEQGNDVRMGETGEILVRGDLVTQGYWKRPEATADSVRDGWFRTGDAGTVDAEGYLFIRDRIKDMIVSGAENIYPVEIETVLFRHRGVDDAAVIGVPDDKWGEIVMAVIVRKPGIDINEKDLDRHCRGHLGGFKVPKRYLFVDALPRNASGKVLKRELRSEYWKDHSRMVS